MLWNFFRHTLFIIYSTQFIPDFIHGISQVVNISCTNIYWLLIAGYTSVTFWKGNSIKTRCRASLTSSVCMDDIGAWGKRPLLVCSKGEGGWYESITIHTEKPVVTHESINSCCPRMRAVEGSFPWPWVVNTFTIFAFEAIAIGRPRGPIWH